jgi:hypothetical protein
MENAVASVARLVTDQASTQRRRTVVATQAPIRRRSNECFGGSKGKQISELRQVRQVAFSFSTWMDQPERRSSISWSGNTEHFRRRLSRSQVGRMADIFGFAIRRTPRSKTGSRSTSLEAGKSISIFVAAAATLSHLPRITTADGCTVGGQKRCQEPFTSFGGLPRGRIVVSSPSRLTIGSVHRSSPKRLSSPNTTPNRLQLRLRLRCVHMCGPTARPCQGPIRQKLLLLRGAKLPTPQTPRPSSATKPNANDSRAGSMPGSAYRTARTPRPESARRRRSLHRARKSATVRWRGSVRDRRRLRPPPVSPHVLPSLRQKNPLVQLPTILTTPAPGCQ